MCVMKLADIKLLRCWTIHKTLNCMRGDQFFFQRCLESVVNVK